MSKQLKLDEEQVIYIIDLLDLANKNTRCPIKLGRTSHTLLKKLSSGDFPGGTLVKSLPSPRRVPGCPSLAQELRSHVWQDN